MPVINAEILVDCIKSGRKHKTSNFYQFFNFKYADGIQMLTLGGIFTDESTCKKLVGHYKKADMSYINDGLRPFEISVPPLTPAEKMHLDQIVHKKAAKPIFELDAELLKNYKLFYRYYPTFSEIDM